MESKEIELDETRLNNMKRLIIDRIKQNINTKDKTHQAMVDDIREIITSEVKKNY